MDDLSFNQENINDFSQKENLKIVIQDIFDFLEQTKNTPSAILDLSKKFSLKRRRLYDIINVFVSIGLCKKANYDQITWLGKDFIFQELSTQKEKRFRNGSLSLNEMFPTSTCIGISNLTSSFLLLFYALKVKKLDLRYVSKLFSENTTRYKTTLCKLYQICFILNALGITQRSNNVCEVILNDEYFYLSNKKEINFNDNKIGIFSMSQLLNRPIILPPIV